MKSTGVYNLLNHSAVKVISLMFNSIMSYKGPLTTYPHNAEISHLDRDSLQLKIINEKMIWTTAHAFL